MAGISEILQTKKGVRAVVFLIIAALLFVYLNKVFSLGNSNSNTKILNAFYKQEENTLDFIYIGTSATNRYFIPAKAYNDTGIAGFNLATMGLPMIFVPNLMEEAEKTQDPQLYIIELRNVLSSKELITDAHVRRVVDNMKESPNKWDAVHKAIAYTEGASGELGEVDDEIRDYLVPIIKYHGKLTTGDIRPMDFIPWKLKNAVKGYVCSYKTRKQLPQKKPVYSDRYAELAPEMEQALTDVLDACDHLEDGKQVLFVLAPYSMGRGHQKKFNTAIRMVTERGYPVLDCNQKEVTDAMGIDWERDFYNSKHVNYVGAEKYTTYLTSYLTVHYDLPDHRGEEDYKSWQTAYNRYTNYVKKGLRDLKTEEK